ncbi:hypothetical protein, partial [Mycobacterium timonense]|uniref:hypothetical protein n=1 Tax=Mycobacterium timonense TaxID=701043 RepID=UPI001FEB898E
MAGKLIEDDRDELGCVVDLLAGVGDRRHGLVGLAVGVHRPDGGDPELGDPGNAAHGFGFV